MLVLTSVPARLSYDLLLLVNGDKDEDIYKNQPTGILMKQLIFLKCHRSSKASEKPCIFFCSQICIVIYFSSSKTSSETRDTLPYSYPLIPLF